MPELITSRRSFITGLVVLVAAPAIVRVSSIMPVKTVVEQFPAMLPPGTYSAELLHYNEMDARMVWKVWQHNENYGISSSKFKQIITNRINR